jgi:hypothetical protein
MVLVFHSFSISLLGMQKKNRYFQTTFTDYLLLSAPGLPMFFDASENPKAFCTIVISYLAKWQPGKYHLNDTLCP